MRLQTLDRDSLSRELEMEQLLNTRLAADAAGMERIQPCLLHPLTSTSASRAADYLVLFDPATHAGTLLRLAPASDARSKACLSLRATIVGEQAAPATTLVVFADVAVPGGYRRGVFQLQLPPQTAVTGFTLSIASSSTDPSPAQWQGVLGP